MTRLLCVAALTLPLCAQVRITAQGHEKVAVEIDGKPFTVFYIGPETPKPYLAPLLSASGKTVTRGYPMENVPGETRDHPHHRGLWFTHGEVNDYDFWANEETEKGVGKGKGLVVLKSLGKITSGKHSGSIQALFDWDINGKPILTESRKMTFYSEPALRTIDFDITLTPLEKVTFGDTKEGTFAIRLATELQEDKHGGKMVSSEGKQTEKEVWGSRAAWVDYFGSIGGEALGVAIMDHPGNPRHPTYWHSRAYGLFAANPFGVREFENDKNKNGALTIVPGQPLRFRYRVVIHPGDYQTGRIAELYRAYAGRSYDRPSK